MNSSGAGRVVPQGRSDLVEHHVGLVGGRAGRGGDPDGVDLARRQALRDHARGQLVQFLTSAPGAELDRVLTFQTLTAGTVTASKHKIASNVFLHGIRHWGQIATVVRQNGFADQWPHDMLLSNITPSGMGGS